MTTKIILPLVFIGGLLAGFLIFGGTNKDNQIGSKQDCLDLDKDLTGIKVVSEIVDVIEDGTRYQDTLYYTVDEWCKKTKTDIDNDKKARVNNWKAQVKAMSEDTTEDFTDEELRLQKEQLQK